MFNRLSSRYPRPSTSSQSCPRLSAACLGRYAAVWVVCGLTVALGAQSAAPFNDSIRVADLRADLFFLAGDGFKGRLVGTPENALAAEWVRSRFERAGLKPGAPNGSFVQNTQLMMATLGEGSRLEVTLRDGTRLARAASRTSIRSASAPADGEGGWSSTRASASPRRGCSTTTTASGVKGSIALILDHEPGERDPASPFDGVVTAEAAVPFRRCWRRRRRARSASCSSPTCTTIPAAAELRRPGARVLAAARPPRIDRFMLASWATGCGFPSAQISPALAEMLIRGTAARSTDLVEGRRDGPRLRRLPLAGVAGDARRPRRPSHRGRPQHRSPWSRAADPQLKDEVVIVSAHHDHEGADGDGDLQRRGRRRVGHGGAAGDRRGVRDGGGGGPAAAPVGAVRVLGLGGARPAARRVGVHRAADVPLAQDRRRAQHGHGGPQQGSARWAAARGSTASRCRRAESNANERQHPRLQPAPRAERPRRAGRTRAPTGSS